MCCRQSALSMCTVSFVNAQCSETRSLAANKSLRVSILLAAEGNTIEGRFVFPSALNRCARSQNIQSSTLNLHLVQFKSELESSSVSWFCITRNRLRILSYELGDDINNVARPYCIWWMIFSFNSQNYSRLILILPSPTSCITKVKTSRVDSLFVISLVLLSYVTAVQLTSLSKEKNMYTVSLNHTIVLEKSKSI
jgi:hypothetical protein